MTEEHYFESRADASAAAADRIAALIRSELDTDGSAAFVVSGGTTPGQCFDLLSKKSMDWTHVEIVLSDERWVPVEHKDSNERLVRETLTRNEAATAGVLSIYQDDQTADERCDSLQSQFPETGFACAMVGMGSDGHFASLFPDADCLAAGLNIENRRFYLPVRTAASLHPRISMTLGALLRSDEVLLLFFGENKLAVYEQARDGDTQYPIAALLAQQVVPVNIFWAP